MKKALRALISIVGRSLRRSPALVIAAVALLVALGGRASALPQTKPPAYVPSVIITKSSVSNGEVKTLVVACPAGTKVFSGGYAVDGQFAHVTAAAPSRGDNGYVVAVFEPLVNITAGVLKETANVEVIAYCAPVGKPVVFG